MAERRMFHRSVVESDAFLDLPVGVQALYFHLGMHADDDGFINCPRQIARKLRRPPRELQQLLACGFAFDFDGILVLRHWKIANNLKADRKRPLNFPNIARQLYLTSTKEYSLEPQGDSQTLFEMRQQDLDPERNPKRKEQNLKEDNLTEMNLTEPNAEDIYADPDRYMRYLKQRFPLSEERPEATDF